MKIQFILACLMAVSMAAPVDPGAKSSVRVSSSGNADFPTVDDAIAYHNDDPDALEDRDEDLRELMTNHKDNVRRYVEALAMADISHRHHQPANAGEVELKTDVRDLEKRIYHRSMLSSLRRYRAAQAAKEAGLPLPDFSSSSSSDEDSGMMMSHDLDEEEDDLDEDGEGPVPYDDRRSSPTINNKDRDDQYRGGVARPSYPFSNAGSSSQMARGSSVRPVRALPVLPASVAQSARMSYRAWPPVRRYI